jgi:hypothetical protein
LVLGKNIQDNSITCYGIYIVEYPFRQFERDELTALSQSYDHISDLMWGDPVPEVVSGFLRNARTGLILPATTGEALICIQVLGKLKDMRLRAESRQVSQRNVKLATKLGAKALKDVYILTEDKPVPIFVSKAARGMHSKVERALQGLAQGAELRTELLTARAIAWPNWVDQANPSQDPDRTYFRLNPG